MQTQTHVTVAEKVTENQVTLKGHSRSLELTQFDTVHRTSL